MQPAKSKLWELVQRRDMKAAALYLVAQHADEVLGLCRAMVRDETTAEDLSQDVFGRAFAALATFRGEASSRTWILQIARNRCIDHLRVQGRTLRDADTSPDDAATPEPRIDDLLEARGQVHIGLASLEENERALVMLRFGHGLGYAELATTFGLSEGTTRMRISRAVAKMRMALQPPTPASAGFAAPRRRAAQASPSFPAPGAPPPPAASAPLPPSPAPQALGAAPPLASPFASAASDALRERLSAMARATGSAPP